LQLLDLGVSPSKVRGVESLLPRRHRRCSHLSWGRLRSRVLYAISYGDHRVSPRSVTTLPFPARPHGFLPTAVPRSSHRRFILSCAFTPLQSLSTHHPPSASRLRAPSLGFSAPFATSTRGVHWPRHPNPEPFRPRRFSRPRRISPPLALWVCFTPLPRPGFALQGLSLQHSRASSSLASCPPVVGWSSLPARKRWRQEDQPVCRALLRAGVRCRSGWFRPRATRSPHELHLPRVSLRTS
jgi:hypothetical protein